MMNPVALLYSMIEGLRASIGSCSEKTTATPRKRHHVRPPAAEMSTSGWSMS